MSSIIRLEGTCVDPNVTEGLSAAIADPLWNLSRQWQVGEFRGEDAATPIIVEAKIESVPVNKIWSGDSQKNLLHSRDKDGAPIEALVEADKGEQVPTDKLRLEMSASLLHAFQEHANYATILKTLQQVYPFELSANAPHDTVGNARLSLLAQKYGFDGYAVLLDVLISREIEVVTLVTESEERHQDLIIDVLSAWSEQESALIIHSEPNKQIPSTWVDRVQEYRFGVSAAETDIESSAIALAANDYPGGQLDWFNFDIVNIPDTTPKTATEQDIRVLSSPLQFAGQPASRFWELEEGDTYFGDLGGGPDDLARSVIASYAAVAGDDWYVIPATLPSSTVNYVAVFRVLDDFDPNWKVINSISENDDKTYGADRPWRWFELSLGAEAKSESEALLFLPPVTTTLQQGQILDKVEFRRDEMANLAWAIEHVYHGQYGRGVKRETPPRTTENNENQSTAWDFQLGTEVPANWLPLLPVRSDPDSSQVVLRRGRMAETISGEPSQALGILLTPDRAFMLNEEEIPNGGIKVIRRAQMTRSADGAAHLWYGRKKSLSSGPLERTPLEFDTLTGWPKSTKKGPKA